MADPSVDLSSGVLAPVAEEPKIEDLAVTDDLPDGHDEQVARIESPHVPETR